MATTTQIMYILSKAAHRTGHNLIVGGLVSPVEAYSLRWDDLEGVGTTAVEAVLDLFAKALSSGRLEPDDFQGYKRLTVYRVITDTTPLTRPWLRILCTSDYERISCPFPSSSSPFSLFPYVAEFVVAFRGSRNTASKVIQDLWENLDLQT